MESEEKPTGIYFAEGKNHPPCFAKVAELFESPPKLDIRYQVKPPDAQYDVKTGINLIMIFSVVDKEDLAVVVNWAILLKQEIRDRKCLVFAFLKPFTPKFEELLARAGCYDVLRFDTTAKAFAHKVNRSIRLLGQVDTSGTDTIAVSDKSKAQTADANIALKNSTTKAGPISVMSSKIDLLGALTVPQDFWLFRKKAHAKRYNQFWFVELIGPSPTVGKWEEAGPNRWKWTVRELPSPFETSPLVWIFTGKKPEYSWVINRWGFASETPHLGLYEGEKIIASRFEKGDGNVIKIANNSRLAIQLFPLIRGTFERDYRFEMEKESDVPWADRTDSKSIDPNDWGTIDVELDIKKDWGKGDLSANAKKVQEEEVYFASGLDAMKPIVVKGQIKNYDIEIIQYEDDSSGVLVGLDRALIEMNHKIQIAVTAENLGEPENYILDGKVTHIEPEDELGKTVAMVTLDEGSAEILRASRARWDRRQMDIMAFFNQTKGIHTLSDTEG